MTPFLRIVVVVAIGLAATLVTAEEVTLVIPKPLPQAAVRALGELRETLVARGLEVRVAEALPETDVAAIVVGVAEDSSTLNELLIQSHLRVPLKPESLLVSWLPNRKRTLVIAGGDERGLIYALRDAARGIAVTPPEKPWSDGVAVAEESPFLRVRNVSLHLFNADCEREWFFSEDFWRFYFARLSLSRFNRCTLTFCDQTNYLCPPYAYLVEMPEYPQVKVEQLTAEERAANRAMLRRIAELADEYAIDFDLGIWMQAPVAKWSAPVMVTGLPEGAQLADYCALGMQRLLEACPHVDGIQLRMNEEAGVAAEQQTAFYRPMFMAIAACGRPIRLELRYKGLQDATIEAALDEKLDVTVSTKFWAEHFGQPYHPTVVDSHYAADRYSFGTLLRKPRRYRVTYQLWTVGSQRLTLWGDPQYAAQFARSCTLGDGEGFEVFAPLTNKGYGNRPGAWLVIKNPEYRVGRWEQERYWMFYLSFGRMGYNPETNPEVWRREFRHRFGTAAAPHVESAYQAASQVLPLITTALMPSASEWYWWPEMDTGGNLREYARIQTSDPGRYAAVRAWQHTPDWRWEDWDVKTGYIDEKLTGQPSGRSNPIATSGRLFQIAEGIRRSLTEAVTHEPPQSAEWRNTNTDCLLLAAIAEYHAAKLLAAMHEALYEETAEESELWQAIDHMHHTTAAWQKLVDVAYGVYHDDLVFGVTPDSPRSKQGHHHSGHWRDRLAEIEADAVRLNKLPKHDRDPDAPLTTYLADIQYREEARWIGLSIARHDPPKRFVPGRPLELRVAPWPKPKTKFSVRIRPLDQTRPWKEYPLQVLGETKVQAGSYSNVGPVYVTAPVWGGDVPAEALDPHFDVQYYFVAYDEHGRLAAMHDYQVVPVDVSSDKSPVVPAR